MITVKSLNLTANLDSYASHCYTQLRITNELRMLPGKNYSSEPKIDNTMETQSNINNNEFVWNRGRAIEKEMNSSVKINSKTIEGSH
jgi:hypothetical protein